MSLDFSAVRPVVNGETVDQEFLNRGLIDLINILQQQLPNVYYTKAEVDALLTDDSLINAIIFGS